MNIKNKKVSLLIVVLIIFIAFNNRGFAEISQNNNQIYEVQFPDQKPYIDEKNYTMVPIRFISECLDAAVNWNSSKKQLDIYYREDIIRIMVGSNQATKYRGANEKIYNMGTNAVLNQGRVFVPLRFISEAMGVDVLWDEKSRTAVINNQFSINISNPPLTSTTNSEDKVTQSISFYPPKGVFYAGDSLYSRIVIRNHNLDIKEVWLSVIFVGPTNEKYELPGKKVALTSDKDIHHEMLWNIPEDIVSGNYQAYLEVWDRSPEQSGAISLGKIKTINQLMIYRNIDNFNSFNGEMWRKTDHTLERTSISRNNVSISDGKIKIHMPRDTFEGGEFQSNQTFGFGAYEIRMKIPDVPSSITGFFLYKLPGLHNEIDIEVYNQKNGEFFLTTYADGEKKNIHIDEMPFDLTEGFHNYRIEYYPEKVAFYIDDVFIKAWTEGFTKEDMYIVVNSWYPNWLEGIPSKESDSYVEIDWIRY